MMCKSSCSRSRRKVSQSILCVTRRASLAEPEGVALNQLTNGQSQAALDEVTLRRSATGKSVDRNNLHGSATKKPRIRVATYKRDSINARPCDKTKSCLTPGVGAYKTSGAGRAAKTSLQNVSGKEGGLASFGCCTTYERHEYVFFYDEEKGPAKPPGLFVSACGYYPHPGTASTRI